MQTIDNKRTGVRATPTAFTDEDCAEPGAFELKGSWMLLACPGCGHVWGMHVGNPKPPDSPSWAMTGTLEAPTLRPAVNCRDCCGWHGFLTDGVFESV